MDEHEHIWHPVPLRCGRYFCACGTQGYRSRAGIRVVRRPDRHETSPTARNATTGNGGPVPACPSLDQQERK